jgi:hypothetical protein
VTPSLIAIAMLDRFDSGVLWGHGGDRACECVIRCAGKVSESTEDRWRFYAAFLAVIGEPGVLALARWNDAIERRWPEVEAALQKVARGADVLPITGKGG